MRRQASTKPAVLPLARSRSRGAAPGLEANYTALRDRYELLREQLSGPETTSAPVVDAAPAAYEIITEELQEGTARPRWAVDVVIPEGTSEGIAAACAEVVREYLNRGGAEVVIMFGVSSADQIGLGFDRCRASGSNDGQGYTGDGENVFGDADDGRIQVEVGSAIEDNEMYYFPRDE